MQTPSVQPNAPCPRRALILYFLRLGAFGFGGPIALAGDMQRDLVERRRWVSKQEYLQGLALAQLSPGPLASQLAMYLGWVRFGAVGAAAAGLAFVLPSFALVVGLAHLYIRHGGGWMSGVFYGVGAAVISIIARSSVQLARVTLGKDPFLWAIAAVTMGVTAILQTEIVWLFVASGVLALGIEARRGRRAELLGVIPAWLVTGIAGASPATVLGQIAWLFTKSGMFVFGSGLAIVPFLYAGVVREHHWLDEQQFRDAVAVAMITPGPVVITAGFIGYLTAGLLGAAIAVPVAAVYVYEMARRRNPLSCKTRWLKAALRAIFNVARTVTWAVRMSTSRAMVEIRNAGGV